MCAWLASQLCLRRFDQAWPHTRLFPTVPCIILAYKPVLVCVQQTRVCAQDDLLNPNLTVLETLSYTAELRLEPGLGPEERTRRVDAVIEQASEIL